MLTGVYGDLDGGICYGIGGGIILKEKMLIEAIYFFNKGEWTINDINGDVKYSKITISLGTIF